MADIVVLVRSRPFFGAQLVMFPALYQLKRWYPEHRLRVVARDPLGPIFEALPWVDEFVLVRNTTEEWRAIGPRCAILLSLHPSSERHGLLALLRHPSIRIGYRNGRLTDRIWTHSIPANTSTYRALHGLELLAALHPLDPLHSAAESVRALAASLPSDQQVEPGGIVLMPGGGAGDFKKWGIHNFIALTSALQHSGLSHHTVHVVLGPAEATEAAALRASVIPRLQLWEQPSLAQLASLVSNAHLIVANDCGPSHLGQCSAQPFIGLFDAHKPEWFWPRQDAICLTPAAGLALRELAIDDVLKACQGLLLHR